MIGRRLMLVLVLISVLGAVQLQEASAKPVFRYVEFNGERKWPGQTHIVQHGVVLRVVAALKEPYKQSMKADLIIIDENGDSRVERMTRFDSEGINEWHEYSLDTSTLNPGPYRVRIRAWNAAREEEETVEGVKSEEVVWGDLYLSLQEQPAQAYGAPKISGFPWEAVVTGVLLAAAVIVGRRHQPLPIFP